jgi:hypothetical protein
MGEGIMLQIQPTPGERQFIASLVTAMRLGLINQRSSYAFIDLVGKMR